MIITKARERAKQNSWMSTYEVGMKVYHTRIYNEEIDKILTDGGSKDLFACCSF